MWVIKTITIYALDVPGHSMIVFYKIDAHALWHLNRMGAPDVVLPRHPGLQIGYEWDWVPVTPWQWVKDKYDQFRFWMKGKS